MAASRKAATGPSVDTLAQLVSQSAASNTLQESLHAVVELAVRVGLCDAASITVLGTGGTPESVAFTDDLAHAADGMQYDLSQGPSLDTATTGGIIEIPDVAADRRWPQWAPRVSRLGIARSVSLPLATGAAPGSLNLYSTTRPDHQCVDLDTARAIAAYASMLLGHARTVQNIWRAIESRNLIGQAQGILMARYGLTVDGAFAVLRRYSQNCNIKLVVVARELTITRRLPDPGQHHRPPTTDPAPLAISQPNPTRRFP